jgi:ABC-2 type transport system ATP-binding protein
MSEVERLCDRVGIIREGEVVQTGTLDDLRHLTRYAMTVTTDRTVEGLDKLDGVFDIAKESFGLHFYVETTKMGAVIAHLNNFGIKKLESVPPSLEELFMQHYTKEGA